MKNNFQSNGKGRNQRVWQLLISMLFILTMGIGQMWGAAITNTISSFSSSSGSSTGGFCWSAPSAGSNMLSVNSGGAAVLSMHSSDSIITQLVINVGQSSSGTTLKSNLFEVKVSSDGSNYSDVNFASGDDISNTSSTSTDLTFTGRDTVNAKGYDKTGQITIAFTTGYRYVKLVRLGNNFKVSRITYTADVKSGGGGTDPVDPTITFNNGEYIIGGSALDLSTLFTSNSSGAVTYSITNAGTTNASLASDGKSFSATAEGTATVQASQAAVTGTYNAKAVDATITVLAPVAVTGITITPALPEVTVGNTVALSATISPDNASDKTVTWSVKSGSESYAEVSATGVVTGLAEGNATIVATANDGSGVYAEKVVAVAAAPAPCYTFTAPLPAEAVTYAVNDVVAGSDAGGEIKVLGNTIKNTAYGLSFELSSSAKVEVTLGSLMKEGTQISVTVLADYKDNNNRGLLLQNGSGTKKADWLWKPATDAVRESHNFTYTVVAGDGLAGSNVFRIARSTNAIITSLTVSNCGAELLALTSAVSVAGKATVTLDKSYVAAGGSATATYSDIDAAYEFDGWEITSGDATIADATVNPAAITMGTTASTITLKLKAASVKYLVHFDSKGGTSIANQEIEAGGHASVPTAPTKFKYTFGGWSETDGGSTPADLSAIAITAEKTFYAIWTPKVCPTSGTIFSLVSDGTKAPISNTYYPSTKPGIADLTTYATVSGGIAQSVHATSSNNQVQIQTTTAGMKLSSDDGYIRVLLECPLQEGDTIKLVKDTKIKITFDSLKTAAKTVQLASGTGANKDYYVVAAGFAGEDTIHVRKDGSNVTVTSVKVIRPAKFAVTFNMHDHGDQVAQQNIIKGGKVSEPATTDITGWDFGGWYKESTYDNEWDFDNDVVEAATELHAKWTAHVASNDVALGTLSVNGEAITIVPSQTVYAVELPFGTTAVPAVTATANDENVKAFTITQALAVDGSATIYVKAEDNSTEATYTINFSVATSKDLELVWDKTKQRCDATTPAAIVKSDDATVSTYINKMTFTGGGEGSSLNVGNTAGNMFTLSAKAGYAFQAMSFFGKIQDATCEYSLDGGAWTELASTKTDGDKCYANIFSAAEVHEFRLRSTGTSGVWIRNMQLTIVEACTPIVVAWDEEPVEFEVGKSGYAIAATANNSGAVTYSSTDGDVIAVNGSTGALTVSALGSVTLKAATAEGDGTAYCANSGNDIEISKAVNTYYLVTFDGQNGEAVNEVKYYSGDAAIALPAAPSYPGYDFQGWFDAETGGDKYLAAITPAASMTVYAQWQAQCDGATITTQPTGASYLTGRTATALVCEATAGNGGALTYEWFTCDDELKTNPVAATATPSTAVAGTYYYFCKVTEEGCAVEAFSNVVTITIADKDAICIIKSIPTSGTEATVDGVYQGSAYFKGNASNKKLSDQYNYVGVELAAGYTFQAGDKVVLNQTAAVSGTDITKFYVFTEVPASGKTYVTVDNAAPVQGDNWFEMPAELVGASALYIARINNAYCNPSVGYLAVYRACAPILSKITVNSVEGTPDNTNHVTIEVPASTTQTQLEAIAYEWVSNNDAWTADPLNAPVAANTWEFGVENTVTFTDKDGDASEYYITVNKAAASSDATLSALTVNGQAVALADGVYAYDVELPYGTTAVPTVVATAHHAGAVATVDPCTLSGATITVVPESGVGDKQVYTLTFTVAAWEEIVIWDGSYMTAVETSPTAETELRWATTDFGSIGSYTTTYGEKSYSKYLPSGGASTGRYMTLTVPAGYVAKFYVVMATHSDTKERGMFIGSNLVKDPDATSVLELSNNDRDVAVAGMSEIVGAGTWYINPNNSIDFQEIRAYLRPGYARIVSNNIGTLCVDHNVAAADLFGATFYQIAGKEPQYGKIVFDEVFELEAGEPYIFQSTTGSILMFYGATEVANPVAVKGMIGSFGDATLTITEENKTSIMYIAQNKLWNCEDLVGVGLQVVANRCYIDYSQVPPVSSPNPAPGRRRIGISGAPQVATGNENINASETPVKVMIDGQMYILRGEKMYDATGRLVK